MQLSEHESPFVMYTWGSIVTSLLFENNIYDITTIVLDSGSMSRWSDPNYRKIYQHIFDGNWEEHDSFDVSSRGDENMNGSYSFFRAFQGKIIKISLWLFISYISRYF